MRFLHTSDWHVGRTIGFRSREGEHHGALQQVVGYAREHEVDCVLIAGDVFDTATPSPESERLVYDFFRELHGAGIPAVVIAGNHDHPRRFEAIAPLLRSLNIHAIGDPKAAGEGGDFEVVSRDGRETAVIAALPWVTERRAVDFVALQGGPEQANLSYTEALSSTMDGLSTAFRPDCVNVLMSHALIDDAAVGPGGGERKLSLAMGIYGLPRQRLPQAAQYVALGHVHKAQELVKSPAAWYSGSMLQLDFGEVEQEKSVNLVEVHARQPSQVTQLPITAGRKLIDIGSPFKGVGLNDLASCGASAGDAWLRVFVDLDLPVANLVATVRATLPNAVHVERVRPLGAAEDRNDAPPEALSQEEMFEAFYRSDWGRSRAPSAATMAAFRQLLEEEADATVNA